MGSGTAVQCNFPAPRPPVWLRCGLVSLYSSRLYEISAFFNLDFDCPRDHQVSLVLFVAMNKYKFMNIWIEKFNGDRSCRRKNH